MPLSKSTSSLEKEVLPDVSLPVWRYVDSGGIRPFHTSIEHASSSERLSVPYSLEEQIRTHLLGLNIMSHALGTLS